MSSSPSSSLSLGKTVFFALGAVTAAAAYAAGSYGIETIRKMGDKRRKKRDDWSKYEVEQTPDRFPIPLLKSFLFHERTPYQPAKGKRGYRASTYSDAQGVLQPGVFPLDTALAYRVFSFLEYDDVARAAGVCSSWSRFMAHLLQDRSFVRRCAARGLSPVYRGAIWRLWAQRASNEASDQLNPSLDSEMHKKDAEAEDVTASLRLTSLPEASRVVYERMAAAENPLAEEIHRDTNRTLMHHDRYADDTEAIESLERMLRAYAMHDSEVGYCQGMNFIAAFVLMHVPHTRAIHGRSVPHSQQHQQGDDGDEEEKVSSSTNDSSSSSATKTTRQEATAYWFMFTMMQGTRFNLRLLYTQGLPRLVVCKYQFQRLFEWFLPKLASHFERHNISPELFMTEWFMTMFTYRAIPVETSARIWDLFLVDGWKALHRVGLAILSLSQETLLSESFEGSIQYLKQFPDQGIFQPDLLIPHAMTFKVTNRLLHRLHQNFIGDTNNLPIPPRRVARASYANKKETHSQ